VRTTSGGVIGAHLRCGHVEIRATSGDIALDFAGAPQQLTATTRAGNVDIAVPGNDPYNVGIETSAGDRDVSARHDPGAARTIGVQTSRG
jgi:DUF4097 and DUF4098 domain-containing protein YvlB